MRCETLSYHPDRAWTTPDFPHMDSDDTLVLAFAAPEYLESPGPLRELAEAYPRACFAGCSTSGEIFGRSVKDGSLSVCIARFDRTKLRSVSVPVASAEESFRAGRQVAESLVAPGLRAVLVLSEGVHVNGSELVRGLNAVLPESVVVTGGLAGDGDRFQRTWILHRAGCSSDHIVAVGFYGDHVRIGHGSKGGWDIFGPERVVTRSKGNVLYELDGKPALALYKRYLGDRASGLPATGLLFPLALRENAADSRSLVRTILAVDESAQSLTFAGDVPEGWLGQLMKANFDRLVDGSHEAAMLTRDRFEGVGEVLAVAISCVGRRLVLGGRIEEEVDAALSNLPPETKQVGFYSYGEISPYSTGACDLHNQTMTLTAIGEV